MDGVKTGTAAVSPIGTVKKKKKLPNQLQPDAQDAEGPYSPPPTGSFAFSVLAMS